MPTHVESMKKQPQIRLAKASMKKRVEQMLPTNQVVNVKSMKNAVQNIAHQPNLVTKSVELTLSKTPFLIALNLLSSIKIKPSILVHMQHIKCCISSDRINICSVQW